MWGGSGLKINFVDFSVKKVLFYLFNFIRKRFVWLFKILYFNISLKNVPHFNTSPFLGMNIVQTEIPLGECPT